MGGISTIGSLKLKNFIHIVINNYAHDSVGGQETSSVTSNLSKIALACSYNKVFPNINDKKKLNNALKLIRKTNGPILMEVIVKKGSRKNLGRPRETLIWNKKIFIKNINKWSLILEINLQKLYLVTLKKNINKIINSKKKILLVCSKRGKKKFTMIRNLNL